MIKHIIDAIPKSKCFFSSEKLSIELDRHLHSLPWEITGHRLDWSKITKLKYLSLDFNEFFIEGNYDILHDFSCFSNEYTIFLYSSSSPCLIIKTDFVIDNFHIFDSIYHATYFFSVEEFQNNNLKLQQESFLEYDPSRNITGVVA